MAIGLSREEAPPLPAEQPPPPRRKHPLVTAIVVVLVVVLAAAVGWIALRGYLARQELKAALPAVGAVRQAVQEGDLPRARAAAAELEKHAASAEALTSDLVWRLAETLPWAGQNLAAVRVVAAATDTVAGDVVRPLVAVAGAADPRALDLAGGRIDLAPLIAAQPDVERAQAAFHRAQTSVAALHEDSLIAPVGAAVGKLDDAFAQTAPAVDAVGNTARLLPGMLGADGPRTYLLVAQNPAELRATGGLIGSVAVLHAEHGSLALVSQTAGTSVGPWAEPVASIPDATQGLYGPLVGRFLQDVNFTPEFPLAASTAAAMWKTSTGQTVDGVVTMDPVVLSALLKATGPIALPSGDTLSSDNAVSLLLNQVYQRYPVPADQDAFFASAAGAVFSRVTAGGVDGTALVQELGSAGTSGRILLWSARPGEQKVLATTTLAGELPVSTPETAGLGVYFNDATGAKMGYYLNAEVAAGAAICRADGAPTARVNVTLSNRLTAAEVPGLPGYVSGGGHYGVPVGSILTRVAVYGPAGGLLAGVTSGGAVYSAVSGTDRARPVAVADVQLAPGESKTITVEFLELQQTGTALNVAVTPTLPGDGSTPTVGSRPSVESIAVECPSGVK